MDVEKLVLFLNRQGTIPEGVLEAQAKGEFDPGSWSGGNFDDAYDMGVDHGRAELAEELLAMLKTN